MATETWDEIRSLAKKMRISAIEMGHVAGKRGAHFGGALSCIEILACLYGGVMEIDVTNPTKEQRDMFLLSKGHAALSFYAALAHAGYFPLEDLMDFEGNGSELPGHPVMNIARGIELSSGSLGMGLAQGIGIAMGYRRKGLGQHVFVLMGDGECDEGSVWEGALAAAMFKLDTLVVVVDCNGLQCDGATDKIMNLADLGAKFASFGFGVRRVDGHNIPELHSALVEAKALRDGKPKAVLASTVKGKGVSFMEHRTEWHHGALSEWQYQDAMHELCREVE